MSLLWKIGGGLLAGLAVYLLITMYGKARYEAGKNHAETIAAQDVADANARALAEFKNGLDQRQAGEVRYVETIRQLPPVTNTIVERSTQYAQTPAGAVVCLGPDRVLWLEETRARLFPAGPAAAGGGSGTLRPDAPGPEPRPVDDERPDGT